MIARIIIPIVLLLIISDVYVDRHLLRHTRRNRKAKRTAWFIQSIFMLAYSISLASTKSFAPQDTDWLNWYLLLLGLWALPKFIFTVCSFLGWQHCEFHHTKTNWGNPIGATIGFLTAMITVYGYTLGFSKIEVRHVVFYSKDLPDNFDGYRIVQFSDAHVGTYSASREHILKAAVDSINKQKADLVVFTGDLQNMTPSEIVPHEALLSCLRGKDGVVSVLGNHDYAYYLDADDKTREENCKKMVQIQKNMGWKLLMNENIRIRRNNDSIVVAGMEYEGNSKKVPNKGDIKKTLDGITTKGAFILMLQHDPTSWESDILPHSTAQLTLSGHTHAGQIKIFGWSPASLLYKQWGGMFYIGDRAINVSTGLGGFAPFRFGCPGEIVVVTLKKT